MIIQILFPGSFSPTTLSVVCTISLIIAVVVLLEFSIVSPTTKVSNPEASSGTLINTFLSPVYASKSPTAISFLLLSRNTSQLSCPNTPAST